MKIDCRHGYFIFEETKCGDVARFMGLFGVDLVRKDTYFTFEDLEDAPTHSIEGGLYLDAEAIVTVEGEPWDVMRANELVYDFDDGLVVPIDEIITRVDIDLAGDHWLSNGLIMPGSLSGGDRVSDYAGYFSFDTMKFRYSEISYV